MSTTPILPVPMQSPSPWHDGERALQERIGVAEQMEQFGRRVIRDFLPDQHRDFYAKLPFLIVGSVDDQGRPWASLIEGVPGFVHSPDQKSLRIDTRLGSGDPAGTGLASGASVGLLGIELHTRRRNRLNGKVMASDENGMTIAVEHAFGNCPQYIQKRSRTFAHAPGTIDHGELRTGTSLGAQERALIRAADTFFVASYVDVAGSRDRRQVDVSHRGGKPGFVQITGDTLTIPDFAGNLHFNTLGNLKLNPRAGLLFVDFERGDVLQLCGHTELILEGEEIATFQGAERLWRFHIDCVVLRRGALALRFAFDEYSPNSLLTGSWEEAAARRQAQSKRESWRSFRIARIVQESVHIRSFHLEPADGAGTAAFVAGQHLPIRMILPGEQRPLLRTYSLSSAPSDGHYRISVKREGRVSRHLHDTLTVGDLIEVRAPQGSFTLDASARRPAVLLSAGVGVTPLLAMLRHIVYEGQRTRYRRPTYFIQAARGRSEFAFNAEVAALAEAGAGSIAVVRALSRPEPELILGVDFEHQGHVDATLLKNVLGFDDHDFYLCGPAQFMQGLYDQLRALRVADERIHAESFGPASLKRNLDGATTASPLVPVARTPVQVIFARSAKEARWTQDEGTLLELAESRGLSPEYSCRGGSCGTCRTTVIEGQVTYAQAPEFAVGAGEALVCCAVPAAADAESGRIVLDL